MSNTAAVPRTEKCGGNGGFVTLVGTGSCAALILHRQHRLLCRGQSVRIDCGVDSYFNQGRSTLLTHSVFNYSSAAMMHGLTASCHAMFSCCPWEACSFLKGNGGARGGGEELRGNQSGWMYCMRDE